jgi:hypothetical protein
MLIPKHVERLCEEEKLFRVEPLDSRSPQNARTIYVSRCLYRFLETQSGVPETNALRRRLQSLFDRFVSGKEVHVALAPKVKGSDIKRLSPKNREVWEFKIRGRRGKGQARVFGRFAATDVFIALTGPVDRADCDYQGEICRCQRAWRELLPDYSPVCGRVLRDYISAKAVSFGDP